MPTYIYRREDGSTFEVQQRISEDALTVCPTTGQPVRRVISGKAGLVFKGDGFYLTDYTSYGKEGTKGASAKDGAATPAKSDTAASSGEGTSAPAPAAASEA